jgi:hypothetical protein
MIRLSDKKNGTAKYFLRLAIILVPMAGFVLGSAAPQVWAFGGHYRPEIEEFEEAQCGFEVNATDFDTGFYACVDAEGWKWLKITRNWDLLFWSQAAGKLGKLGITELCFESSEPEGKFKEVLDKFPPGKCRFKARQVDGGYLKSTNKLTHDFACVAEDIEFKSDGDVIDVEEDECVPADRDLVISWGEVDDRLIDLKFDEEDEVVYTCVEDDEIEVDGYQVFIETGEDPDTGEDFEPSQELSYDPFDEGASITVPEAFLREATPYKFEVLVIEESGNRTIREVEFMTCE